MIEQNAPELLELYANKFPASREGFYASLYRTLDIISNDAYRQRNYKIRHCEEELADYFSDKLDRYMFYAEREGDRTGHVDIIVRSTISGQKVEWYGECKILSETGSNWDLHQGYLQLTTRYSFGSYPEHGLIVFNKKNNNLKRVNDWWIYLRNKASLQVKNDCFISEQAFFTDCIDNSTGRTINIRHFFVPLHYNPQDKSGVKTGSVNIQTALRSMKANTKPQKNQGKKSRQKKGKV
ncbi:hypothetical protein PAP10c_3111 [Pantoea agglomerans]|nr:hypothetical protein PAP10c_3111 [Pantoea agglomerans]